MPPPRQETAPRDISPVDPPAHAAPASASGGAAAGGGGGAGHAAGGDPYNRNAGNVELLKVLCDLRDRSS
jgi:hypothetical protein